MKFRIHTNLLPEHKRQGFTHELVDSSHPSDGGPVAIGQYRSEREASTARDRTQAANEAGAYYGAAA